MAWRSSLPVYLVGALGTATAGLGIGFGLGQYTVTGMDPFIGVVRSNQTAAWRPDPRDNDFSTERLASVGDDFRAAFDPARPGY